MSTFTDVRELGNKFQSYNLEVFKEPRGIMRVLQMVFALINLLALRSYDGYIDIEYKKCKKLKPDHLILPITYPFNLFSVSGEVTCANSTAPADHTVSVSLMNDFSSEAEFLNATCWISIVFVIVISIIYVKYSESYESNGTLALVDFVLSVVLAVLWISSMGAWGYGQSQLKSFTKPDYLKANLKVCTSTGLDNIICGDIYRSSVTGLTISLLLSFLNFFLWAASLWFIYKETPWYLQFQRAG